MRKKTLLGPLGSVSISRQMMTRYQKYEVTSRCELATGLSTPAESQALPTLSCSETGYPWKEGPPWLGAWRREATLSVGGPSMVGGLGRKAALLPGLAQFDSTKSL